MEILHAWGSDGLLLALMVLARAVALFGVPVVSSAPEEHRPWSRFLIWLGLQLMVLLPWISLKAALLLLAWAAVRLILRSMAGRAETRSLQGFLLLHALELTLLFSTWKLQRGVVDFHGSWSEGSAPWTYAVFVAAAFVFNGHGAGRLVGLLLDRHQLSPGDDGLVSNFSPARGRAIGVLERMLALTLVLAAQWGALGLILAAKSVARFRDLEQREFSEYYLIGTLASILVATTSGLLLRFLGQGG